ncbi:MAG: hypothetical protein ABJH63_02155 [Rhizobiaceae bacterium]
MATNFILNDNSRTQYEFGTSGRDVFVIDGDASDYGFRATSDGGFVVWNWATGAVDLLYNVEGLQFKDAAYNFSDGELVRADTDDEAESDDDSDDDSDDEDIYGTEGKDVWDADYGDQTYHGGEGYNQVDYEGSRSDYKMTKNDDGSVTVSHPEYGTDTLHDIDGFWFKNEDGEGAWYDLDTALSMDNDESSEDDEDDDYEDDHEDDYEDDYDQPEQSHHALHLSDGDDDVKAEFELKIKKGHLEFKLELGDKALDGLGHDVEYVNANLDPLKWALKEAGVEDIDIKDIEIKDDKIKIEMEGYFRLDKEDAKNLEDFLPNKVEIPIWVEKDGEEKEICLTVKPDFDAHSPIAFDMNGDGKIGVTGETSSIEKDADAEIGRTVEFDIDADGKLDTIEWFDGSGDGILVDTTKIGADGSIDGSALFGDEGGKFANGYEKLQSLDVNGNGTLEGDELTDLGLWIDDGDAVLEAGELQTADAAGIAEISTQMQLVDDAEGKALMQSSATLSDGSTVLTEDVWFAAEVDALANDMAAMDQYFCEEAEMEFC